MKSKNLRVVLVSFVAFFMLSIHSNAQCCKVPDSLKVLSVTDSSFCVSWHKTDSLPCDSATTGTIRYRKVGTTTWTAVHVNYYSSTTVTFCDTATACTLYEWQVRNACKKNDTTTYSSYAIGTNFTTLCERTCCTVPDSLAVTSVTDSSFCLKWYTKDSIPCDTIIRGVLQYRKVGTTAWTTVTVNYGGTLGTITRCDTASACTTYQWKVRNVCAWGIDSILNSSFATGPNFTTTCDTPRIGIKSGVPINLYPNPAKGSITLTAKYETAGYVHITVSDMTGITRIDRKAQVFNKSLNVPLDISRLPKGVYFITVSDGKTVSKVSFIKEE